MERKPFVTYHGEPDQFNAIQVELLQSLPREKVEWKRSSDRVKMIQVDVNFVPFNADLLPHYEDLEHAKMLLQLPMLHVYFTDCPDTDAYRIVTKEKIAGWLNLLKERKIADWMIVLVEPANPRRSKSKLLPKFSVVDKIKNDFCGRQTERLIVLHEPNNPVPNNKTMESWAGFVGRLRQLFVTAYNRTFTRYEDVVRAERERRVAQDWYFCNYFLLQEELALAYESMGIYKEALVQYDELDALFSQFIINSQAGEKVSWLSNFTDSCNCWDGLNLSDPVNKEAREIIKHGKPSLLDLRNYLFGRQCALLFKMRKPSDVAGKSYEFMLNCVQELTMLEVPMPPGSVACWVFLTCVEVLQKYERMSVLYKLETHSHFTANLWAYAQKKLAELGNLCGLMPNQNSPSSDQLNTVVNLLSGMGKSSPATQVENSPNQKLREALSSTAAFNRHYLELSELAMGNYKHIGRLRSVALIGRELAQFYQMKGDHQKAEIFLEDALRLYEKEGWRTLIRDTRQELADSQKELTDLEKYIQTCCFLMGDPLLEEEKKSHYSEQVAETAKEISANFLNGDDESEVWIPFQSSFGLMGITIVDKKMSCSRNDEVRLKVELFSRLSSPVTLKTISLCFQDETPNDPGSPASSHSLTGLSLSSLERQKSQDSLDFYVVKDLSWSNQREIVPDVQAEVRTAEGTKKQIALVTCRNLSAILRRQDSSTSWGKAKGRITKDACSESAVLNNVTLDPGRRSLEFVFKSDENGQYRANQLVLELMDGVSYLLNLDTVRPMVIEVFSPEPQLTVDIPDELYAGIPQEINLTITTGHQILTRGDSLPLKSSEGLFILPTEHETYAVRTEGGRCHLQFLEDVDCNKDMVYPVMVLSTIGIDLEDGGDDETINHIGQELELEVPCPWHETVTRALHFHYPFTVTHRCRTIKTKKFIQISVTNISDAIIRLSSVDLEVEDVSSSELEQIQQPAPQIVGPKQTHSFVWSLLDVSNSSCKSCLFEFAFTLRTCPSSSSGSPPEGRVQYVFGIADLRTKYIVSSCVTPADGKEICSTGELCNFTMNIESVDEPTADRRSLLYEIQTLGLWVMCGKNKGNVAMTADSKVTTVALEILPLVSGFIPLPDVKFSEYPEDYQPETVSTTPQEGSGDSSTEFDADQMKITKIGHRRTPWETELLPLDSNQVYYKSRATQVHVFPEFNASTVEVSLS